MANQNSTSENKVNQNNAGQKAPRVAADLKETESFNGMLESPHKKASIDKNRAAGQQAPEQQNRPTEDKRQSDRETDRGGQVKKPK